MASAGERDIVRSAPGTGTDWRQFPWWLVIIVGFLLLMAYLIFAPPPIDPETGEAGINEFNAAYDFIIGEFGDPAETLAQGDLVALIGRGISLTIFVTLVGFFFAMIIGLLVGLGRISQNIVIRTIAITYVEFIRGVPTLVLIFTLALVIVPEATQALGVDVGNFPMTYRGISALAIIYGAFLAEVFRAGIESIARGQMEAARSLGMSYAQAMRYIILPQAIRNILPALGNDFIAMLKDSSLLSVLAIREITQLARLYAGSSFRFRETYLVLTFFYLAMTLALSLLLRWYEGRIRINER